MHDWCLQQDSYLQALVRAVQQGEAQLQQPAVQVLACLLAQDPSTHYICAEVNPLAHCLYSSPSSSHFMPPAGTRHTAKHGAWMELYMRV